MAGLSEATILRQLFGSKNFAAGGVWRVDQKVALRATTEARLVAAADAQNASVALMGTDYVVFKRGSPLRNVSKAPLLAPLGV